MQATAHLRHLRMSPRKVRLVADLIRGMDVTEADAQLAHLRKAAALPIRKLVASAAANAAHNAQLARANLYIRAITVDQGPTLKRFRPRAFGRAAAIRKRSSHISLVLDERVPTQSSSSQLPAASRPAAPPPVTVSERPRAAMPRPHVHGAAPSSTPQPPTPNPQLPGAEPFDVRRKGKHRLQEHEDARSRKRRGGFFKRLFTRRTGER